MGYYAADVNGYIADVASIGGWRAFVRWADEEKSVYLAPFVEHGLSRFPKELAKELSTLRATVPEVETTRKGLEETARKASEILILSDGVGGDGLADDPRVAEMVRALAAKIPLQKRIYHAVRKVENPILLHVLDSFAAAGRVFVGAKDLEEIQARVPRAAVVLEEKLSNGLEELLLTAVAAGKKVGSRELELRTSEGEIALGYDFGTENPLAAAWAKKHAGKLIKGIVDTSVERVGKAISDYVSGEGSFNDLVTDIELEVGDRDRAEVIAHHESMTAVSEGQRQSWDDAVESGLLTGNELRVVILSDKPCEICQAVEAAGPISLDEPYDVDGEDMDGPPFHVSCECTEGIASGGE